MINLKHTHATREKSCPEPWVEVEAAKVLEELAKVPEEGPHVVLTCVRNSGQCGMCAAVEYPWTGRIPRLSGPRSGANKGWSQPDPCLGCGRHAYNPVWDDPSTQRRRRAVPLAPLH